MPSGLGSTIPKTVFTLHISQFTSLISSSLTHFSLLLNYFTFLFSLSLPICNCNCNFNYFSAQIRQFIFISGDLYICIRALRFSLGVIHYFISFPRIASISIPNCAYILFFDYTVLFQGFDHLIWMLFWFANLLLRHLLHL